MLHGHVLKGRFNAATINIEEHQLQQDTTTETTTSTTTTATNNNIIQSHAFKTERFALYADMCQLVNGLF